LLVCREPQIHAHPFWVPLDRSGSLVIFPVQVSAARTLLVSSFFCLGVGIPRWSAGLWLHFSVQCSCVPVCFDSLLMVWVPVQRFHLFGPGFGHHRLRFLTPPYLCSAS
jgi:hypothetical protein